MKRIEHICAITEAHSDEDHPGTMDVFELKKALEMARENGSDPVYVVVDSQERRIVAVVGEPGATYIQAV